MNIEDFKFTSSDLREIKDLAELDDATGAEPLQRLAAIACFIIKRMVESELKERSDYGR